MAKVYLLSRGLDPVLGVFTGVLAFILSENNPRSAPPPGHTLKALTQWRWAEYKQAKISRQLEEERKSEADLERMKAELDAATREAQSPAN